MAKILVVEDSKLQSKLIVDLLLENSYETLHADSGESTLSKVKDQEIDLILMDMVLPDTNGIQLIGKVRELPKLKETPIIVLSGLTDKENVVESLGLEIHDYITKPYHPKELINRINIHLRLHQTSKKLKDANDANRKFLSLLGHDLKGAFGNLYSTLDLVDRFIENVEERKAMLKMAKQGTFRVNQLLDELLLWGSAISDGIVQHNEKFCLNDLAKRVIYKLQESVVNKGLMINQHLEGEALVDADRNMIEATLRNIISNARKFTQSGGVIDVEAKQQIEGGISYQSIVVHDTGIGMPPEVLEHLFDKHQLVVRKDTEGNKGIGLGLLISSEFLKKNKGKIIIQSTPGNGTTITILLPVA